MENNNYNDDSKNDEYKDIILSFVDEVCYSDEIGIGDKINLLYELIDFNFEIIDEISNRIVQLEE
jgi:hypothetical protein